eukprot:SAG31_NODE_44473_length_262_cov_1.269939_1_plen_80_part_01
MSSHKDGGGKSGKEPSIRIVWLEGQQQKELRAVASTGMGTSDWSGALSDHAAQAMMAAAASALSAGPNVELGTLQSMPPA